MATAETIRGNDGMMSRLASNQEQRAALQIACYNALLFVLVGIALCAIFALYNLLYMFLHPMLWAVLVGTVLFPIKKKVTDSFKGWLSSLQDNGTTLPMGLIKFPFLSFLQLSDLFYETLFSSTGVIIAASYAILKILSYERTFMYIISYMGRIYSTIDSFILVLSKPWMIPLMVLYACAYATWIFVQEPMNIKKVARLLSCPLWIYVLAWISLYFGPFRAAVFGGSAAVLILISLKVIGVEDIETPPSSIQGEHEGEEKVEVQPAEGDGRLTPTSTIKLSPLHDGSVSDTLGTALSGDRLIRIIFGLCALLWVVRHDTALILLGIPLAFAILLRLANQLGITAAAIDGSESFWNRIYPKLRSMVDIVVAGPLRQFFKVLFTSDQMLASTLYAKMDVFSTIVVMLGLAVGAVFGVIFVGFQLHGETVHLVRLTSNVLASRPDWLSAMMNYTEDQLEENNIDIDDYVEKAYKQGRVWLVNNVRSLTDGKDANRADMLEKQVKQMVDKIYAMWEERNATPTDNPSAVARADWLTQLQGVTDFHALKEEIKLIVQENIDTLLSVGKTVWAILAVNISFLTSIMTTFAGVIFGFGHDIINLLIEIIVFLTMVYYLLSASKDRWLPMHWAAILTSFASNERTDSGYDVTSAVEHAISGVFVLSAKMSIFYGLYTYFVHSLFDLNIVFLPCLLASIFAAVPIMAPWIVCVFGVFELFLVRGESAAALVFALMSFAPVMFADITFYRQVKYSHPYVTGLAVIGGMYWLGLQGAIIGPIVLCSFLVMVNVYLQNFKASKSEKIE